MKGLVYTQYSCTIDEVSILQSTILAYTQYSCTIAEVNIIQSTILAYTQIAEVSIIQSTILAHSQVLYLQVTDEGDCFLSQFFNNWLPKLFIDVFVQSDHLS